MPHLDEGTIHAWLDGALPPDEAARVEAHAAGCAACGTAVAEARGLVAAASRILTALDGVPGGVVPAPARAALPDETARPAPAQVVPIESARPKVSRWRVGPLRAAAALLLVAGGSAVVIRSARNDGEFDVLETAASVTDTAAPASAPPAAPYAGAANTAAQPEAAPGAAGAPAPGAAASRPAPPGAPPSPRVPTVTARRSASAPLRDGAAAGREPALPGGVTGGTGAATGASAPIGAAAKSAVDAQAAQRLASEPAPAASTMAEAADVASAGAPGADESAGAPALRRVSGWTVAATAVTREGGALVRRTTYVTRPGVRVTLVQSAAAASFAAPSARAAESREEGRRAARSAAAAQAAPASPAPTAADAAGAEAGTVTAAGPLNVLRWQEGSDALSLSGALSVRELEALREQLRAAARAP